MRVIAGSARRLTLVTPSGLNTRPTNDRIKETLFNMLMPYIFDDTVFLDLFAGSGQIGIEALSRGAKNAVFVDSDRAAVDCINKNLETTRFTDRAKVISGDCITALKRLYGTKADIVFMDPPYDLGIEPVVLKALTESDLLADDCLVIVEARIDKSFDFAKDIGYNVLKEKEYKTSKHVFLEKL